MRMYTLMRPVEAEGYTFSYSINVGDYTCPANTIGNTNCCGSLQIYCNYFIYHFIQEIVQGTNVSIFHLIGCSISHLRPVVEDMNKRYKDVAIVSLHVVKKGDDIFSPNDEVILVLDVKDYYKWKEKFKDK